MSEPWQTILTLAAGFATGCCRACSASAARSSRRPRSACSARRRSKPSASTLPSIIPSAISGSLRYRREGLIIGRVACWTLAAGLRRHRGRRAALGHGPGQRPPPHDLHRCAPRVHCVPPGTRTALGARTGADASTTEVEDPVGDLATPTADLVRAHDDEPERSSPLARRDEVWRLGLIGVAAGAAQRAARHRRRGPDGARVRELGATHGQGGARRPRSRAWASSRFPGRSRTPCSATSTGCSRSRCAIGVIPGARLGAHLAIRSSDRGLRLAVAIVLGSIALVYGVGEILALVV